MEITIEELGNKLLEIENNIDVLFKHNAAVNTFLSIREHISKTRQFASEQINASEILCKKSFLHAVSVLNLYSYYENFDAEILSELGKPEPISMWAVLRSQFESYVTFNHVFINPESEEDKLIRYNTWVIESLTRRQKIQAMKPENIKKQEKEANILIDLKNEIENTDTFKNLNPDVQEKAKKFLKNPEKWKFVILENKIIEPEGFKGLAFRSGMVEMGFKDFYSTLSIFTHPTYNSVMQLNEIYENDYYLKMFKAAIKYSAMLINFMTWDYCKLIPEAYDYFNVMNEDDKNLVILDNFTLRGEPKLDLKEILTLFNKLSKNYTYGVNFVFT